MKGNNYNANYENWQLPTDYTDAPFLQACDCLHALLPTFSNEEIENCLRGFWSSRGRKDLLLKIWYYATWEKKALREIDCEDIYRIEIIDWHTIKRLRFKIDACTYEYFLNSAKRNYVRLRYGKNDDDYAIFIMLDDKELLDLINDNKE